MKVVKFGGSSLANGPQLEKVLNIMLADTDRKFLLYQRQVSVSKKISKSRIY